MKVSRTTLRLATTPAQANTSHLSTLGFKGGRMMGGMWLADPYDEHFYTWYRDMMRAGHVFVLDGPVEWRPPRASKPRKRTMLQGLMEIAAVQRRIGPSMFVKPNPFGGGMVPGPRGGFWVEGANGPRVLGAAG